MSNASAPRLDHGFEPDPQSTGSLLSHLECARCARRNDASRRQTLCGCDSPLLARYQLGADPAFMRRLKARIKTRAPNLWRYRELLPVRSMAGIVSFGEGFTPLYPLTRLGRRLGLRRLFIKDESTNPGGTFKARGAAVALSRARELGVRALAIATNGNAGEAWALYAARARLPLTVLMPRDAQPVSQRVCAAAGAHTHLVDGTIGEAAALVARHAGERGWFDVSTLKEPYRLEGKKTLGYELAEQLGWSFPDVIVVPTGGGITVVALHKACCELKALGWVQGPLPRIMAVQAAGCAPLQRAFEARAKLSTHCENPHTRANGLRVPKPFGDFMVLEAIAATGGHITSVTDREIADAIALACRMEGLCLCPEAAAVLPGLQRLIEEGVVRRDEHIVILGTGSGLKYSEVALEPELPQINRSQPALADGACL